MPMHRRLGCTAAALATGLLPALPASAQFEPFIGQIMCAGFNFAPRGWAPLNGQLLQIAQNQALFSLLGTTYGGDGQTTFALPDLRGRLAMHMGTGPGLTPRTLGERAGAETHSLSVGQLPAHQHAVAGPASQAQGTLTNPAGAVPATRPVLPLYAPGPGDTTLAPVATSATGGNQPVPHMPPYLVLNCFIALQGIFPSPQ